MTITDGRIKKKMRKALKYVNKNKQGNDYMKRKRNAFIIINIMGKSVK